MRDVNKMILMGRLGSDPQRKETRNGHMLTTFPLATARWIPDSSQKSEDQEESGETSSRDRGREETQWHRVVVWGKQGENCAKYLKKGQTVYVEGSLRTRKYKDPKATSEPLPGAIGQPEEYRYVFEVHAESVVFLSQPRRGGSPDEGIENQVATAAEPHLMLVG